MRDKKFLMTYGNRGERVYLFQIKISDKTSKHDLKEFISKIFISPDN